MTTEPKLDYDGGAPEDGGDAIMMRRAIAERLLEAGKDLYELIIGSRLTRQEGHAGSDTGARCSLSNALGTKSSGAPCGYGIEAFAPLLLGTLRTGAASTGSGSTSIASGSISPVTGGGPTGGAHSW